MHKKYADDSQRHDRGNHVEREEIKQVIERCVIGRAVELRHDDGRKRLAQGRERCAESNRKAGDNRQIHFGMTMQRQHADKFNQQQRRDDR